MVLMRSSITICRRQHEAAIFSIEMYPLVMSNKKLLKMVIFHSYVNVYQRVYRNFLGATGAKSCLSWISMIWSWSLQNHIRHWQNMPSKKSRSMSESTYSELDSNRMAYIWLNGSCTHWTLARSARGLQGLLAWRARAHCLSNSSKSNVSIIVWGSFWARKKALRLQKLWKPSRLWVYNIN